MDINNNNMATILICIQRIDTKINEYDTAELINDIIGLKTQICNMNKKIDEFSDICLSMCRRIQSYEESNKAMLNYMLKNNIETI